jgi:hypothetical protein
MLQLPNPPWYRRWSFFLASIIVLAGLTALLGWRGLQQADSPSATTQQPLATIPPEPSTTQAPEVQPSPTTARTPPGVLWQAEGSDTGQSRLFRAPRAWRIEWSFDCSAFGDGKGGNFKLTGEGAFEDVMIQKFDKKASGQQSVSGGGFGRLVITSVCDHWEVRAVRS